MSPSYVYIALLEDGRFYVGITHVHPDERALRHQRSWGGTLTRRNPLAQVLWFEKHPSSGEARRRESQLKKGSHAKNEALVIGDLDALRSLSRTRKRP